ncbi:putative oxidoreductase [Camellia lanceoleosa]|uniref:Oxidoreductase n=1 Tax=Camellia lanceoleosa TaxID=1840588 RepID=A0ACC0HUN6_9ERIC|nr:putative oxidoreductase [Camellia lanceoleosa]
MCRAITLSPNSVLYAIASRSLEKASSFVLENGFSPVEVKVYDSYEGVLEDPNVDAVYLPLPTSLHVRWAVLAAEKGKHVLLEKPAAPNLAELDRILEACECSGVQFMDATMWMHHPRTSEMRTLLSDAQRFGQLKSWKDGKVATFYCSFLTNLTMDLSALGTKGNLHIHDFAIPLQENVASYHAGSQFRIPMMSEHAVANDLPQEALMVSEFAGLVMRRNGDGLEPPEMWWRGVVGRRSRCWTR